MRTARMIRHEWIKKGDTNACRATLQLGGVHFAFWAGRQPGGPCGGCRVGGGLEMTHKQHGKGHTQTTWSHKGHTEKFKGDRPLEKQQVNGHTMNFKVWKNTWTFHKKATWTSHFNELQSVTEKCWKGFKFHTSEFQSVTSDQVKVWFVNQCIECETRRHTRIHVRLKLSWKSFPQTPRWAGLAPAKSPIFQHVNDMNKM